MSSSRILPWPIFEGAQEGVHTLAESTSPGPGRSTSEAALSDLKKRVARRNEETQKAARRLRAVREKERLALRRSWDRL